MAEEAFDGFDHTVYKEEVEQRWGADAYARSDAGGAGSVPRVKRRSPTAHREAETAKAHRG